MEKIEIVNLTRQITVIEQAEYAKTFFSRAKGLLGRKNFNYGQALVIAKCNSIHTFFMKFPIDVAFVHKNGILLKIIYNMQPGLVSPVIWKASYVIEFPAGFITKELLNEGDVLEFIKVK